MDINAELTNKKENNKTKLKKLPEKFKYYSKEIIVDKEKPILEAYKNIHEQLINIDLNQTDKSINETEMKYLERITKDLCMEILKEEFEEETLNYNKQTKPTDKEIVSIISQAEDYNLESDNEKEENIIEVEANKKENIIIKSNIDKDNKEEIQNLNEKYNFAIGIINWNDILINFSAFCSKYKELKVKFAVIATSSN